MTHHFVMTSSLLIKILKIDKFGDFSCDIDYNSRTDVFRDVISLIINQCDPWATEGSLRRTQSVRQPRTASKRSALVISKTLRSVLKMPLKSTKFVQSFSTASLVQNPEITVGPYMY